MKNDFGQWPSAVDVHAPLEVVDLVGAFRTSVSRVRLEHGAADDDGVVVVVGGGGGGGVYVFS